MMGSHEPSRQESVRPGPQSGALRARLRGHDAPAGDPLHADPPGPVRCGGRLTVDLPAAPGRGPRGVRRTGRWGCGRSHLPARRPGSRPGEEAAVAPRPAGSAPRGGDGHAGPRGIGGAGREAEGCAGEGRGAGGRPARAVPPPPGAPLLPRPDAARCVEGARRVPGHRRLPHPARRRETRARFPEGRAGRGRRDAGRDRRGRGAPHAPALGGRRVLPGRGPGGLARRRSIGGPSARAPCPRAPSPWEGSPS
jgi:hypothetical protein